MALSIRLPNDVETRLQNLAALTGRSKTFYVTEAIIEHLDDLEDLYLAEQRLIDIRAGKSQTVPLEEVMKRYGMEGVSVVPMMHAKPKLRLSSRSKRWFSAFRLRNT